MPFAAHSEKQIIFQLTPIPINNIAHFLAEFEILLRNLNINQAFVRFSNV